jgi:hypothetical protein
MPPKKNPETPEEQAKRFQKEARKLIRDGALDPAQGERAVDGLVKRAKFDGR